MSRMNDLLPLLINLWLSWRCQLESNPTPLTISLPQEEGQLYCIGWEHLYHLLLEGERQALFLLATVCVSAKLLETCPTLCDPMDHSPLDSSVHGIFQAKLLEWFAMPSSRGSSRPKDQTHVSHISCIGRKILNPVSHLGNPLATTPLTIQGARGVQGDDRKSVLALCTKCVSQHSFSNNKIKYMNFYRSQNFPVHSLIGSEFKVTFASVSLLNVNHFYSDMSLNPN